MARKLYMQAETGSRLLSHLPVSIDCHVTGHYKHPLLVLAVPLVSSGSCAWAMPLPQAQTGDTLACGLNTAFPPLAANKAPSPSLKLQGTSPHCATAGEPAASPRRWAGNQEAMEEETGEKCPQQKHAVTGGESNLHCQVSPKSPSSWSKLKRTMQELFVVGAVNSDVLIFSPTFTLSLLQKQREKSKKMNCLVFKV